MEFQIRNNDQKIQEKMNSYNLILPTKWPNTDVNNFDAMYKCMSDTAIEFHIINNYPELWNPHLEMDVAVKGETHTPDFWYRDEPLEYKCSLYGFKSADMQVVKEEMFEKYRITEETKTTRSYGRLIFISMLERDLNKMFPRNQAKLLIMMAQQVRSVLMKLPRNKFLEFAKHESLGGYRLLELLTSSFLDKSNMTLPGSYNLETNLEEFCKQFFSEESLMMMEEFININYLETRNMSTLIPIQDPKRITNFKEHPWNKKLNKSKLTDSTNSKVKGTSATKLWFFPLNVKAKELTLEDLSLMDDFDSTVFKKLREGFEISAKELKELRRINKLLAFLQTEGDSESIPEIQEELGIKDVRSNFELQEEIRNKIKEMIHIIKSRLGFEATITKHATIKLREMGSLLEFAGVGKKNAQRRANAYGISSEKKSEIKFDGELEEHDYLADLEPIFSKLPVEKFIFDEADYFHAYECNTNLNLLSSEVLKDAQDLVKKVMESNYFHMVYRWQHFLGSTVAAVSRSEDKYMRTDELIVSSCPYTGLQILIGPSPNERTSGPIWVFGKYKKDHIIELIKNDIIGPCYYKEVGDEILMRCGPFRIQEEVRMVWEEHLWGSLNSAILSESFEMSLINNFTYWSFFFNFSRQCKFILDIWYLFEKSAYQQANFGRFDVPTKFDGFVLRDVRAASILNRIRKYFSDYAQECFLSTSTAPERQLVGIFNPILRTHLTGWNSYQFINYMKQALSKLDGTDRTQKMGEMVEREVKLEGKFINSKFYPREGTFEPYKKLPWMDFLNKILQKPDSSKSDEVLSKWESVSMEPGLLYTIQKMVAEDCLDENGTPKSTKLDFRKDWLKDAAETGKPSKVNMSSNLVSAYGVSSSVA